ncbi:hypothetical protein ACLB1O_00755 [Escherichia coli]
MTLRLRSDSGKRQHLWLAADSMGMKPNRGIFAYFVATRDER